MSLFLNKFVVSKRRKHTVTTAQLNHLTLDMSEVPQDKWSCHTYVACCKLLLYISYKGMLQH